MSIDPKDGERRVGIILEFDLVKSKGVIIDAAGNRYLFDRSELVGRFENIFSKPGVSFNNQAGEAFNISYNPDIVGKPDYSRSGMSILGAAKCPNCDWRLPMLPEKDQSGLRKGKTAHCPDCNTLLIMKSMFIGIHGVLAVGIWVLPLIIRYSLSRIIHLFDHNIQLSISVASFFMYFIQILFFVFSFVQERLVTVTDVEVFE